MKNKKFNYFTIVIYVLIIAALVVFVTSGNESVNKKPDELKTTDFYQLVREGLPDSYDDFANGFENTKIAAVQVTEETLYGLYVPNGESESSEDFSKKLEKFKKGKTYDFSVTVQSAEAFQKEMASLIAGKYPNSGLIADNITVLDYGFYCQLNPTPQVSWILVLLPYLIIGGVLLAFIFFMNRANNKQGMNFGKSRAKTADELGNNVTFEDVAGADEEKQELREIVDFLRNPKAFTEMGARIPKGVLLVGPPGTGKTLLAKAVAGEAKVPFFSISGSEFVEMFVGMGASKVRDLFKQAKEKAPCIVFIDEIDAIGQKRNTGTMGGNDEREQTLNQLLTEMDGFEGNTGVIILAATNRPESLDPALTRPGRFDRRVPVELPDLLGREAILKVHAKKIKIAEDVDFNKIARMASGASGAELANIVNEAALRAVRDGRRFATQADLEESIEVVIAGYQKKNAIMTDHEKHIVAYHEIGHALVAAKQTNSAPVQKITIVPRTSGALGYTMQVEEGNHYLMTREEMENKIATLTGGRAAEEVVFGSITTGASNDIEQATKLARAMITRYGMSDEFGMVALETVTNQYLGGDASLACSADTQTKIDQQVVALVQKQHEKALQILTENRAKLDELARHLYEKETITGEEFMAILNRT